MKKRICAFALTIILMLSLTSCDGTSVLKTREITNILKQTEVILKSDIEACEDFKVFNGKFNEEFTIPGLFEGFIPQGICIDTDKNAVIISGYFEEAEFPSMLCVVDKSSGKLLKYVSLKDCDGTDWFGHAGGAAYSDGYIYITDEFEAFVLSSKGLYDAKSGDTLSFENNFKLNTKGSFCNISNGILWTGTFTENTEEEHDNAKVTTLSTGETFYAYCEGYKLEEGLPNVNNLNSEKNGYIPDYLIAIPDEVHGITVTPTGTFALSISNGRRNNSKIIFYSDVLSSKKISAEKIDGYDVELLACSKDILKKEFTAPPMTAGTDYKDGKLFVLFSSGAACYRNRFGKYPTDKVYSFKFD